MANLVGACVFALLSLSPGLAFAGPAEDANAVVARWSAGYTANDLEAVVDTYWPDAIVLGTISPVITIGTEGIRAYFARLPKSGNLNELGEKHTIVLDDNAVVVAGFYLFTFTSATDGKPVPRPSRFTMLVTRHGDEWRIAHHHSSPRPLPR